MSARKNQIALDAEGEVGNEYYWHPFALMMDQWATDKADIKDFGQSKDTPINCYEFFVMLAIRRGYVTKEQVLKLSKDTFSHKYSPSEKSKAFTSSTGVVWQDWPEFKPSSQYWRPRRGDLVFLTSKAIGGDLAHVVLATAKDDSSVSVISFGEGLEKPQKAKVNATTIAGLKNQYVSVVKFCDPIWA